MPASKQVEFSAQCRGFVDEVKKSLKELHDSKEDV